MCFLTYNVSRQEVLHHLIISSTYNTQCMFVFNKYISMYIVLHRFKRLYASSKLLHSGSGAGRFVNIVPLLAAMGKFASTRAAREKITGFISAI